MLIKLIFAATEKGGAEMLNEREQHHIASVSWGKDSLYMLLGLIDRNAPLDEVVFYDTGMEFQAIYNIRDAMQPLLKEKGIAYTELHPEMPFLYKMFDKPVKERCGGEHKGYSWCGGRCRWGTTEKLKALDKYAEERNAITYVGIAADETKRLEKERKPYKYLPLAEWGMAESDCLSRCYDKNINWMEHFTDEYRTRHHVELYGILDRVSCWCCANKNLKELENMYLLLPGYWEKLRNLQKRTDRPMKGAGKSVFELEERFKHRKEHPNE